MAKFGIVKMQAPAGTTSIGARGEQVDVVDGVVEIPADLAEELKSHGFTLYAEQVKQAAPFQPPAAQPQKPLGLKPQSRE